MKVCPAGPREAPASECLWKRRRGIRPSFEALYELHFERVYAFVASRVRDRATAEDVTSEVFSQRAGRLAEL